MDEDSIYVTVNHIYDFAGGNPFRCGDELFLKKEPDNLYDDEAIAVYDRHGVKCGMIANSVSTVARGTMSAGRVFDRTEDGQKAVVRFILEDCMIAQFQTIVQP